MLEGGESINSTSFLRKTQQLAYKATVPRRKPANRLDGSHRRQPAEADVMENGGYRMHVSSTRQGGVT
jgi:hypothetical protein